MLKPKDWILKNNLSDKEFEAIRVGDPTFKIERETEKAYRFQIETDFGTLYCWAPKSQCVEFDESEEDSEMDEFEALDAAFKGGYLPNSEIDKYVEMCEARGIQLNGIAYNHRLVKFAKEHGVKGVRKGMRTSTLIEKIEAAGLTVPEK